MRSPVSTAFQSVGQPLGHGNNLNQIARLAGRPNRLDHQAISLADQGQYTGTLIIKQRDQRLTAQESIHLAVQGSLVAVETGDSPPKPIQALLWLGSNGPFNLEPRRFRVHLGDPCKEVIQSDHQ